MVKTTEKVKRIRGLWESISDPKNQRTLKFIGGAIAAVVVAFWTVYVYFGAEKGPPPGISANNGGIAAGGNLSATAQSGGTAVVATGDVKIGITLEEHHAFLKRRENELRAELAQAHNEEKDVLTKQLVAVVDQLSNLKESYQKRIEFLQSRIVELEKLKGQFPEEALAAAKAALARGDTSKADTLFRQVEEKTNTPIKQGAEAIYQRGRIAESWIDYRGAYAKYLRATQLQPDEAPYNASAGYIAQLLGLYDKAIEFHEAALRIYRSSMMRRQSDRPSSCSLRNKKRSSAKVLRW